MDEGVKALFEPRSVAVVGASRHPGKIGYEILKNLIEYGFPGKIYPINPKAEEILGLKAYPRLSKIPDTVDLVVVSVPARIVPDIIDEAGEVGAKAAVVIASGFKEVGNEELEKELVKRAKKHGIRVLGPNVFGMVYTPSRLNASFGPTHVIPGSVAFITQSGALGIALMGMTIVERIGVSAIISIGNKADIDDADLLEYLGEDPRTQVILIYMEGLKDGRRFMEVAKEVTKKKPVIVIKAGKTEAGARAVASHTGSLAGNVKIYSTAFRQTGVIEAMTVEEAFDWARAFSYLPRYKEGKLVLVTNGGGAGVLSTDTLVSRGVRLSPPPKSLVEKVRDYLPSFASLGNPIDVTGQISNEGFVRAVMDALNNDEVGAVLAIYCQTAVTDPMVIAGKLVENVELSGGLRKPFIITMIGGEETYWAIQRLNKARIPAYPMPERAAAAMATVINYGRYVSRVRASGTVK